MEIQRMFKESYLKELKSNLNKPTANISLYSSSHIPVDEKGVKPCLGITKPSDDVLRNMLNAADDFEAAVILYEAYPNLTPALATMESFWAYLCHVDFLPYVQKKYPVEKAQNKLSHIETRWFVGQHGVIRNTLASLWWSVYISYDKGRTNPYELTKIFFKNYSFRVVWFKVMLRMREGLLGMLEFLRENPSLQNNLEVRGLYIAKYFNALGATKQLSYCDRNFFKEELEKVKDIIEVIHNRDDITNKGALSLTKEEIEALKEI